MQIKTPIICSKCKSGMELKAVNSMPAIGDIIQHFFFQCRNCGYIEEILRSYKDDNKNTNMP